jgi:hypothetical protein
MLSIFTRENTGTIAKMKYVFRSSTMTTFTLDELVKKMAAFNTTITEADTLAVLNVMKRLVIEYVEQGYTVQTPLGLFFAAASGSTNDLTDAFEPRAAGLNHNIRIRYRPTTEIEKDIVEHTPVERVSNILKTIVNIDVVQNAAGDTGMSIRPGDTILILGDYLKFDETATDQGVFLSDGTASTRLIYYTQNTGGKIAARIENTVAPGKYTLSVHNIPISTPSAAVYKNPVVITA